jgi:3-deoxy-D-manno-octulosonate 8-phosphate phosphatase (KDO 8-P phosphatase)
MDVDGVLTGGEIIVLDSGEEIKLWSVKDRMGYFMLKRSELPVKLAWVTARGSRQVEERAKEIGVHFLHQKCLDKWEKVEQCARELGLSAEQVAYVGDDLVDLKPLKKVGLAVCPPDSPEAVKKACHYQTRRAAGKGAVREVIELLLKAQGRLDKVVSGFLSLFLCAALFLSSCGGRLPSQDQAEVPDQWIDQFTITETLSGLPVWVLNSDSAQIYNKKQLATLDNIRIEFMSHKALKKNESYKSLSAAKKLQTINARLSAPKGEVGLDTHNLRAWGGVEVKSQDGTALYAEHLLFSTTQQKIITDSPVKIIRKDSILLGEGLEATPDLSTVKIYRHEAAIYPKQVMLK